MALSKINKKARYLLAFTIFILIFSSVVRLVQIIGNNFAFTMDQARDMIDIRHMVVSKIPKIVGPTTSINGVFLGPFWYYFNLPAFLLGQGNPVSLVYWNIFWYQLTGLIIYLYFHKKNQVLAVVTSTLFLLMPAGFSVTRYAWNANPMPMFTALFLLLIFDITQHPSTRKKIFLGILSGLFLQVEAAFAIIFLLFTLPVLLKQVNRASSVKHFLLGFLPTLIPQITFEIRHKFIMTKRFINEFAGTSDMLGSKLAFKEIVIDRYLGFQEQLLSTLYLDKNSILLLFVLALSYFIYQKKISSKKLNKYTYQLFSLSTCFLITSVLFYLVFPNRLKHWYLFGLTTPFIFIFSSFFTQVFKTKHKLALFLLTALLVSNFTILVKRHYSITKNEVFVPSTNPSNFANRLSSIDIIYNHAAGQGFQVYSYLPSVYDLPQQYTFWWYGNKKYGYQPDEVAYLPNQPEYIKDNSLFWEKSKKAENSLTYLIVERDLNNPQREQTWLRNFDHLCVKVVFRLPYQTIIQQRESCKTDIN